MLQAAATLALAGAPVFWLQGRNVRRRTARLEEANGERAGTLAGAAPALRIIGLGESPMAAVGLADQSLGVIPRLVAELAAASGQRVEWQTAAKSGATARFTTEKLLRRVDKGPTDLAVVGLGVNDCLALHSARRWQQDLQQLLDAVRRRLEPKRIILTGVPPMQHFPALPFPLSSMLGLRAALLDSVSQRVAEHESDVVHAPMNFTERAGGMFCSDGFHPDATAHEAWARQLARLL